MKEQKKEPVKCWACQGSGNLWPIPWGNPLQNPPHFSLLDCLNSLRNSRHNAATEYEKMVLDSTINQLANDERRRQMGRKNAQ